MARRPTQTRLLTTLRAITAGRPMQWVGAAAVAKALSVDEETLDAALAAAAKAGMVTLAGSPAHSVYLTDQGRRAELLPRKSR